MAVLFPHMLAVFIVWPFGVLGADIHQNFSSRFLLDFARCDDAVHAEIELLLCALHNIDPNGCMLSPHAELDEETRQMREISRWTMSLAIFQLGDRSNIEFKGSGVETMIEAVSAAFRAGFTEAELAGECSFSREAFSALLGGQRGSWTLQSFLGFGALKHPGAVNDAIGLPIGTAHLLVRSQRTLWQALQAASAGRQARLRFLPEHRLQLAELPPQQLPAGGIWVALFGCHDGEVAEARALLQAAAGGAGTELTFKQYGCSSLQKSIAPADLTQKGFVIGDVLYAMVVGNRRDSHADFNEAMPLLEQQLWSAMNAVKIAEGPFDLAFCVYDAPSPLCLPLAQVFDSSAVWWYLSAVDMIPPAYKRDTCNQLELLAGDPRVAVTPDEFAALILRADTSLVLPVLPHAYFHVTGIYSASASAEVLMVRNPGWTSVPGGAVFSHLLDEYIAKLTIENNYPLSIVYLHRTTNQWLSSRDDVASRFRAAVFVPDALEKMAAREYYAMGVPLFFVSQHMLAAQSLTHGFYQFNPTSELGLHCGRQAQLLFQYSPFAAYPEDSLPYQQEDTVDAPGTRTKPDILASYYWTSMVDLYHLPGVQIFDSFVGLLWNLLRMDANSISRRALEHTAAVRAETLVQASRLLKTILLNAEGIA